MTQETKHNTIVRYCVGWSFDGPIYASHYLPKGKPKYSKSKKEVPVMGWKQANKVFKHEHNN